MTVSDRFMTLLYSIQPSDRELAQYDSHRSTVATRLATVFPGTTVDVIGSHERGSAISGVSDLDLLARLPREHLVRGDHLKTSDTVIRNVKDELSRRYDRTAVGKDGVAIAIGFGGGSYSVDVVPASWTRMADIGPHGAKRPVYYIPSNDGRWLETAPKAHAEYIAQADARSGGKLKGVAQLLKFWTTTREARVPISSFHIEMVLAQSDVCAGVKSYSTTVTQALQLLARRELAALQDPLGISGYIDACSTPAKRDQALRTVGVSAERAGAAYLHEQNGALTHAYATWDSVFNGRFPRR